MRLVARLRLESSLQSITDNSSDIIAGNLALIASGNEGAIGDSGAGADLNITLSGTLTAIADFGGGGIFFTETGDMEISFIDAGTGPIELETNLSIIDAAGPDTGSPLLHYSRLGERAVGQQLNNPVALAMRYGEPRLSTAVEQLLDVTPAAIAMLLEGDLRTRRVHRRFLDHQTVRTDRQDSGSPLLA